MSKSQFFWVWVGIEIYWGPITPWMNLCIVCFITFLTIYKGYFVLTKSQVCQRKYFWGSPNSDGQTTRPISDPRYSRGEREFPFLVIHSREYRPPIPVPENCELNFPIAFLFSEIWNGIFHLHSHSRQLGKEFYTRIPIPEMGMEFAVPVPKVQKSFPLTPEVHLGPITNNCHITLTRIRYDR